MAVNSAHHVSNMIRIEQPIGTHLKHDWEGSEGHLMQIASSPGIIINKKWVFQAKLYNDFNLKTQTMIPFGEPRLMERYFSKEQRRKSGRKLKGNRNGRWLLPDFWEFLAWLYRVNCITELALQERVQADNLGKCKIHLILVKQIIEVKY